MPEVIRLVERCSKEVHLTVAANRWTLSRTSSQPTTSGELGYSNAGRRPMSTSGS